ncbi:MAG: Protein tyrosine/serine phosphatase [Chthonomonadaceae bacterium]|nr:Protein tyrosine/serine phosphatase [Chthonomonadaceae bacterium]
MISPTIRLPWKRSFAATLLCGAALSALCSCAKEPQTPPVKALSVSTPPPATVAVVTPQAAPVTHATPTADTTQETPVVTPRVSEHDLPNFHSVTPVLLRGAAPTPAGLEALQKMGVKTVIDLRIAPKTVAKERVQLDKMGVKFINLPMSGEPPTDAQIRTFMKTIADPAQQPVFVHCQHGADRTGTMIGIYREQVAGWPYDKTYKEMRKYGFNSHWKKLSATVRRFAPSDAAH